MDVAGPWLVTKFPSTTTRSSTRLGIFAAVHAVGGGEGGEERWLRSARVPLSECCLLSKNNALTAKNTKACATEDPANRVSCLTTTVRAAIRNTLKIQPHPPR